MAQAVNHPHLTPETGVQSQVNGQSGNVTGFFPSTSVFPFQYHSAIAPYSFPHLLPKPCDVRDL
jgi:hypothetical protein